MKTAESSAINSAIAEYWAETGVSEELVISVWLTTAQERRESILDVIHAFEERV